jgi:hypothetical protein
VRIRKLAVDGFRGLPDREFDFADPRRGGAALIVAITGPRGSGKTSLLEAIVAAKEEVAPYGGAIAASDVVRPDAETAKIRVDWELSTIERDRVGLTELDYTSESIFGAMVIEAGHDPALVALLGEYELEPSFGKVEYFHAQRRMPTTALVDISQAPGGVLDRMTRLTREDSKFGGLIRFMVEAGLGLDVASDGMPRPPGRIQAAFQVLCSTKRLAGLYRTGQAVLPGFFDAKGTAYGLGQLSDSELDALLFATTFVRSGLAGNMPGAIVLIDTPERAVGEADAGAFVRALHELGSENQLIVATRSPSVIESAHVTVTL